MQTAALHDVSSQGQELRYLTAHFRDLQGLRMAPFWLELLVLTKPGEDRLVFERPSGLGGCRSNSGTIWLASFGRTLV
jgi:hypothetical protein